MPSRIFQLLVLPFTYIPVARSNIVFHRVQPTCNASDLVETGCLRGQICLKNGTCVAGMTNRFDLLDVIRRVDNELERHLPRADGRCGIRFDGAVCDPTGAYGACCSAYGFCGVTDRHCRRDLGCQSGCAPGSGSVPATKASDASTSSIMPAAAFSNAQEPVLGLPTGTSNPSSSSPITHDGSCGANFGNTLCGDWPRGSCCSMYGYCGNSTAHCGAGCQSGPCILHGAAQAPPAIPAPANPTPGIFKVIGESGVPVMHAALLPNGRVAFIDKVENYTKLILPNGRLAYAAEWDPESKSLAALEIKTNAFCSGGVFLADGSLLSIGGNGPLSFIDPTVGDGFKGLRTLKRSITDSSLDGQSFVELGNLSSARWYASAQILGDGRIFVASGSLNGLDPTIATNNNPTYEILSRSGNPRIQSTSLDILLRVQPYYMYPFIHLLRTGDLFIFVSKSSELWSPITNSGRLVYPDLSGDYRTYPNTGTSILLPLSSSNRWDPEIMVCGGGAYQDFSSPTDPSCGRILPLSKEPTWEMDAMPEGRGMVEGVLLPDGTVVFLNGCNQGAQGFLLATKPTLNALLYNPNAPLGKRWTTLASSSIPRLYHSVALLLLDGTIMIAGSNPVEQPVLKASKANPFVTEFRIEIYTPPYLCGENANNRPTKVVLDDINLKADGSVFSLNVDVPATAKLLQVVLYHGGFVTHSLHMGQRMMFLDTIGWKFGQSDQAVNVTMPPNTNIAPPGPYVIFVLADGVPSVGQSVMVS